MILCLWEIVVFKCFFLTIFFLDRESFRVEGVLLSLFVAIYQPRLHMLLGITSSN